MIKVTLEFANQAELLAYFAPGSSPDTVVIKATNPLKAKVEPGVAVQSSSLTPAAELNTPVSKKTAAAPTAQAPTPAPAASSSVAVSPTVDYPTLQKAVFALANASREAAGEVAASFNVKTFKELSQDQWAPALTAVNLKLESLKAAA
jgi:hypothetical protein